MLPGNFGEPLPGRRCRPEGRLDQLGYRWIQDRPLTAFGPAASVEPSLGAVGQCDEALRRVLDLLLKKEMKLAGERGLTLELTDAAKTRLLAQNDHPEWAARPLRRIIWKFVREPLAGYLLEKNPQAGAKIKVDVDGKGLKIADF